MEILQIILALAVLIIAIPVGLILRNHTKEELKDGKKYFKVLCIVSLILALGFIFVPVYESLKLTGISGMVFISIVSFISWYNQRK